MKIALSLWDMLALAISGHKENTQGRMPLRFELHPATRCGLLDDERMRSMFRPAVYQDKEMFMGVELVWSADAKQAAMITWDNRVEYL